MIVFPVINAENFIEAKDKIQKAVELFNGVPVEEQLIHIDIEDGKFIERTTWGSPSELLKLKEILGDVRAEIHLMVVNPEEVVEGWLKTGLVQRVIVQNEALTDYRIALGKCIGYGATLMISIGPNSNVEKLLPYNNDVDHFQILSVHPGPSGQQFQKNSLEKIKFLRERMPNATIEVDGGITHEVAKSVKEAGANIVVSANYIFTNSNPKETYNSLRKI